MEIKLNQNKKNYVVKKAEVNIGAALLKKKKKKIYDRVTYFIDNMTSNKAYQYAKKKNNLDEKKLLKNFQDKYKKYRNEWANQPSECINNKYLGEDLKKHKRPPLCIDIETAAICDLACPFCFREFIFFRSLFSFFTISSKPIYLTGLKKWVIQKSFFSLSESFSDKTLIGMDDVFEETIAPDFLSLNIFS